jgi:cytochrome c-type biogenesis protein CcmH
MTKLRALATILLIAIVAALPLLVTPLGAQQSDRAKQIGGKFMCMCSCNQVLTQCNHVGCTTSASMLKDLDRAIARGDSEQAITQAFVQEFGTKVYAEPPRSGFSLVAWTLPSIYLVVGTLLVVFVISRWSKRPPASTAAQPNDSGIPPEILERARLRASRETQD